LATARTTAAEVQLAGVPLPMTRFGWLVFTARAARGTNAWPCGFPAAGRDRGAAAWVARVAVGLGFGNAVFAALLAVEFDAVSVAPWGGAAVAQAVRAMPAAAAAIPTATSRTSRMGPNGSGASNAGVVIFAHFMPSEYASGTSPLSFRGSASSAAWGGSDGFESGVARSSSEKSSVPPGFGRYD
jgi:hypothetical protein